LENIPYETVILTDNKVLGETAGKVSIELMKESGKALIFEWSDVNITAIKEREEGFISVLLRLF
jgi:ABC-type sugar transport system substrate-binding protein